MKLPQGVLEALKQKKIMRPTPIQMQGIPTVYEIAERKREREKNRGLYLDYLAEISSE